MSKPQAQAEWAREKQITAQFGLTKMILFNLRKAGKIRSVSLRAEGAQYGARIYNVASINEYIAAQEAAANRKEAA
jgi:hypothetical protein